MKTFSVSRLHSRDSPRSAGNLAASRVALASLQLVGGAASFALWSLLSHTSSTTTVAIAATGLAWGMSAYLPLSLGLPFVLANFYRSAETPQSAARIRMTLRVSAKTGYTATAGAVLLGAASLSTQNERLLALPPALAMAGLAGVSVVMQQEARIHDKVAWMTLSLSSNVAIPAGYLLATAVGASDGAAAAIVTCTVGALTLGQAHVIRGIEKALPPSPLPEQGVAWSAIKLSSPLVPHLFAFGLLMQGPRLATTISGAGASGTAQANYMMLFLGVGFAVIGGLHGVLSTSFLRARSGVTESVVVRLAVDYMILAATASSVVVIAVVSPLRSAMNGMRELSSVELVSMALIPAGMTIYYLFSTLLLYAGRTASLASVSVSAAAIYFGTSKVIHPSTGSLIALFAVVLVAMHVPVVLLVRGRTSFAPRAVIKCVLFAWVGLAPAGLFVLALTAV